jgi:hypothetical protein
MMTGDQELACWQCGNRVYPHTDGRYACSSCLCQGGPPVIVANPSNAATFLFTRADGTGVREACVDHGDDDRLSPA